MGSRRSLCRTQLCLLAFLAFSSLTDASQLEVMSAPNLLRVGRQENIFVEIQDCVFEQNTNVDISVLNYPARTKTLASTSVSLTKAKHFQDFGKITIPAGDFSKDPNMKQYVYLQAQFPNRLLEKIVLVSFQSGYIFIQTDKTLYAPNSRIYYRIFSVTPGMEPVEMDPQYDAGIDIEIEDPNGVIVQSYPVSLRGIHSGAYQLGTVSSSGVWKVMAKFSNTPQQSFSAEFEVKEYVLPSFEVKLTPVSRFFYVDSQELIVDIKAIYLSGEEVDGTAYVVFGVLQEAQKKSLPGSLQRVQIVTGHGVVTLKREHITQTFNMEDLMGSSIFVSVNVLTENGGEMVEAELRGIRIVSSPYTIHLKKTPQYFKPGMSFDVAVEVVNPDGTPAQGVPVVVSPGEIQGFTTANGMAVLTINTEISQRLTITARTRDSRILHERQASATMVALPYTTKSNNYIHIGVDTSEVELGDNMKIMLNLNRQQDIQADITYLLLSRGQLVKHGRYKTRGQVLISLIFPITKDLLPSFRIIAYYHTNDNEVVSDSVWVDVKDSCMGSLKLESTRPVPSYEPRRMFGLKVTGDPGATVGLVSVDKGVYVLNNKHRLTQKKVWDIVEKYDTGCTPGGGRDGMSVFYDAGLLFVSTASGTPYRQDLRCPASSRSKRAIMDFHSSFDEEDDSYMDSNDIVSRTKFPDSWLWADIKLPPCPRNTPDCFSTSFVKNVPLQDSITTRQLTAISLSRTHGICVSEPLEIIVRKEFYIDLRLPYSAVRGEQLEIKAILHNYSPDQITVHVELIEQEHVCSSAFKLGRYRQEVVVKPQSGRSVPFIIIPMKEGQHHIEVKAAVRDSSLNDGIVKILQVVPEGVLVKALSIVRLDPAERGVDGKQQEIINAGIPQRDLVPNTPASTQISVTGREPILPNVISGNSMGSLIYEPSGSGEQNMMHMTLPVIATVYLDQTNQWETVGLNKRGEALQYIRSGYQNELAFRKNDGSFSVWMSRRSSTWLTAYVVKVFAMAKNLVALPNAIICDAVKFLILTVQQPEGVFRDVGTVAQREMTGDVYGIDSDASMTAFCLIAMQESRKLCAASVSILPGSMDKAVAYLERRLPHLTNPYAVAMTSYALANENKLNRQILFNFVSTALSHWPVSKGHVYTLETTAYALLALVRAKALKDARPVVRWLSQQQKVGGGYGSTQATLMVYQAVAEYWASAKESDYNLNVDILLPGRSKPEKHNFNSHNHHTTRISQVNGINQNVSVTATGSGEATLTVTSLFYALPKEKESDCQTFNLSVQLLPEKLYEDENVYKLKIEVLFMDKDRDATMSILEIGLLTGFIANTEDLRRVSRGSGYTIANHEMGTYLSSRDSLIIYLDKISHTRPEEITFRIHQRMNVAVLQPAAVSVYEYFDQTQCVRFYHPYIRNGELPRLCMNDECTCADVMCPMQRKNKIFPDVRSAKAVEVTETDRTDFVYKVRLEEFTDSLSTDMYTVRIMEVITEGGLDLLGKLLTFLSFPQCRDSLDLRTGKTYLIMGSAKDILKHDQKQLHWYLLSWRTWIEYWPTDAECQSEEHRLTCLGMEELSMHILMQCVPKHKGTCGVQRKGKISDDERIAKADETTLISQIDFVYKVRLEEFTDSLSTDMYMVRIEEVLKDGTYDMGLLGKLCAFISYPRCRSTLDLKRDKTYLIMGASKDIIRDKQRQSYRYTLGESTWIEYWPTAAECQTEEHRPTCLGMKELVKHMLFECLN